ncbi:MAG: MFS transporter, partial [Nostocoides sp.]
LLVVLYGATAREVGWALAAYNLSGFVSTLIIPSRADRSGDYIRPLLWCGVLTVSLTIALALAPTLGWAVLALVLLGGPAGVALGLIFAHQRAIGAPVNSVMRTRAVFSFAWAIGPPVATFLVGWFGNQSVLWAVAGIAVVGMGLSVLLRQAHARSGRDGGSSDPERFLVAVRRPGVGALLVAFTLLQGALAAAMAVMALFVTDRLHLDVMWAGVALGTAAALEVPALMAIGSLSQRFGSLRLLVAGSLAGVIYYLSMAFVRGPIEMIALQVLNAAFVAAVAGAGLTVFQDALPRPGLASALFTNTFRVGAIVAGPLIGLGGVFPMGYAAVFLGCALMALAGTVVIVGIGLRALRRDGRSIRPGRSTPR